MIEPARPTSPVANVSRPELVARVLAHLESTGRVALWAAPGYGKSTLLEEVAARAVRASVTLSLGDMQGDGNLFLRRLFEALSERGLAAGGRLRLVGSGGGSLAAAVDEVLRRAGGDVLLVLDDVHLGGEGTELGACLEQVVRQLPAGWWLALAGRRQPVSAYLSTLTQYRKVAVLDERDLAFVPAELARLGGPACDGDALYAETRGWPVASVALAAPDGAEDRLAGYVKQVVLDPVEPDGKGFLLETAVLPRLSERLCRILLGRSDTAQRLAEIAAGHLLAEKVPGQDAYELVPVFRRFLLAQLAAERGGEALAAGRRAAVAALVADGLVELAGTELVREQDWEGLADLMRHSATRLFHSGAAPTVLRWLDRVPAATVNSSPWLLVARERARRQLGCAGPGGRHELQHAQHLFLRGAEDDGRAVALVEEAKSAIASGDVVRAKAACTRAIDLARDLGTRVEIYASLILSAAWSGDLEGAASAGEEALGLLPQLNDGAAVATDRVFVLSRLGLVRALRGDLTAALERLAEAHELAGNELTQVAAAMIAEHVYGWVAARAGRWEQAHELFAASLARAESIGHAAHARLCHASRGELFALQGRLQEAERELRAGGWLCNHWVDPGYFYVRTEQFQQAADIYESDVARVAGRGDELDAARALGMLGVCRAAAGDLGRGRSLLERAEQVHARRGFHSRLPGIRIHLADIAFRQGRLDDARRLTAQALGRGAQVGALLFFGFQPQVAANVLLQAAALGVAPVCAERSLRQLVEPGETSADGELLGACADPRVRSDLEQALAAGVLTRSGIQKLVGEHGLTWRECQIFARYYLPRAGAQPSSGSQRGDLAVELGIAEHTVRHHINSIRSKLDLGRQRGMAAYRWARDEQITGA